jgi:uncharacterized protein (TIGR04168 family)
MGDSHSAVIMLKLTRSCCFRPGGAIIRHRAPLSAVSRQRSRLAIVGDVHDAWSLRDEAALACISDLSMVLFVGDFGNENVRLVKQISELQLPKAVILGNHDAWYTMIPKRRKESLSQLLSSVELLSALPTQPSIPSDDDPMDRFGAVDAQLKLLGKSHVGFSSLHISQSGGGLSVIGARPFAKGGPVDGLASFYERLHGMQTEEEFTCRIVEEGKKAAAASGSEHAQAKHSLVLLAHNGPAGLGKSPYSICGVDWRTPAGDHGDMELTRAIAALKQDEACSVPLVLFGHMHSTLKGGGLRQMVVVDDENPAFPIVYLNAATVPRVRPPPAPSPPPSSKGRTTKQVKRPRGYLKAMQGKSSLAANALGPSQHHFLIVDMEVNETGSYSASSASDVWIQVSPVNNDPECETPGFDARIAEEKLVLRLELDGSYSYWDAHSNTYLSSRPTKAAAKVVKKEGSELLLSTRATVGSG